MERREKGDWPMNGGKSLQPIPAEALDPSFSPLPTGQDAPPLHNDGILLVHEKEREVYRDYLYTPSSMNMSG